MARKKGWLGRISKYLIGGNMAMMFDVYCDMEEDVDKPYRPIEWYFSIAGTTCVELLYRQVGQHKFDPTDRMDTPVYLRVTAADLPELAKTIPCLGPADLIWLDRPVQGIDIRQIQYELKMRSVFKDDPALLNGTRRMHDVRNGHVHGAGTLRCPRRIILWVVLRHIEKNLVQIPPLLAMFRLHGGHRADLRGDHDLAAARYREAIEEADRSEEDPSARHVIAGKAFEGLGEYDNAVERYERAVSADPENASAHVAMGQILAQMGRGMDALARYDKAVKVEPRHANAHIGRAKILLHLGRPDEALKSYLLAAEADPSDAGAHTAAGKLHESQGRPGEALKRYLLAAEADSSDIRSYVATGAFNEERGNLAESMRDYSAAASLAGGQEAASRAQARPSSDRGGRAKRAAS